MQNEMLRKLILATATWVILSCNNKGSGEADKDTLKVMTNPGDSSALNGGSTQSNTGSNVNNGGTNMNSGNNMGGDSSGGQKK